MRSILSLVILAPLCAIAAPPAAPSLPEGPPPPQTANKQYIGDFAIPSSSSTVNVKMISAFNATWGSSFFFAPNKDVPVPDLISIAGFAFLLEHPGSGRRVLFDMGIRKDLESLSPKSKELTSVFPFIVDKDVPDQLVAGGVSLSSIDSVIWSHSHPDHVGDMRKMPGTSRLYVGAGTLANGPGYPADPESLNVETDFTGHNITEIQFDGVKIAGQKSHDFFGDGSMFLLDLPGHLPGHLAALVRVTANPSSFVLLAGDAEHHIGLIRPSPGVPLPHACIHDLPALLQSFGANEYSDPFGNPAPQNASLSSDAVTALASIEKVKRFDAREDVWVVLSHDASLHVASPSSKLSPEVITLFPATINDWKKNGWKETSKFAFLEAGNRANVFVNDTSAH